MRGSSGGAWEMGAEEGWRCESRGIVLGRFSDEGEGLPIAWVCC